MARRVQKEAWPLLQQLLEKGVAVAAAGGGSLAAAAAAGGWGEGGMRGPGSRKGGVVHVSSALLQLEMGGQGQGKGLGPGVLGPQEVVRRGDVGEMAPAAIARVQAGVMGCLEGIAGCEGSAAALQGMAWEVGVAVVRFLDDGASAAAREAAVKLLAALGRVDGDAMWLLLLEAAQSGGELEASANSAPEALPDFRDLLGLVGGEAARGGIGLGENGARQQQSSRVLLGRGGARRAVALWRALKDGRRSDKGGWHHKVSHYLGAWKQESSI